MPNRSVHKLLQDIGKALGALPGVFSTVQWGGRAYKLPGPKGNRNKPKLLAHVWLTRAGDAVGVDFKLKKQRAAEAVDQYDWLKPHSFRTLAPSGWVSATVRTAGQVATLKKLLKESRALYGEAAAPDPVPAHDDGTASPVAHRIDAVMRQAAATGWRSRELDDPGPSAPKRAAAGAKRRKKSITAK